MKSMTGYGRGECLKHNRQFTVEIKAVNHKFNDITIKLPHHLISYEDSIKKFIGQYIYRGKIDIYISFKSFDENDIIINFNEIAADSFMDTLNKIKNRYGIKEEIKASFISQLPEVLTIEKKLDESFEGEIWEGLKTALSDALNEFIKMRCTEGENLKISIIDKLSEISSLLCKIEIKAPEMQSEYEKRLRQKLEEKLKSFENIEIDESRLLTEVMLFSDKTCIDEEITRLKSHISQMKMIIEENTPIGRKLDFLIQEINRELNTIGSKSNSIEITENIVNMKSEVEKIREQIQNIE